MCFLRITIWKLWSLFHLGLKTPLSHFFKLHSYASKGCWAGMNLRMECTCCPNPSSLYISRHHFIFFRMLWNKCCVMKWPLRMMQHHPRACSENPKWQPAPGWKWGHTQLQSLSFSPVVPSLASPGVLALKRSEVFITSCAGQDFWKLHSKNVWGPKAGNHCSLAHEI